MRTLVQIPNAYLDVSVLTLCRCWLVTSPSPTQVFVTSNISDKTSENLLSYLLVDARMGTVAPREQYIFYSDLGHVPQTKGSGNLGLS